MTDMEYEGLVDRIEAALQRSEVAADRLRQRQSGLRVVAKETLVSLDRLIDGERKRANG